MNYPKILYDNRLGDAAPVASSTAAGNFDVLNLRDFQPFTWWQPAAMPATVRVDCGAAAAADYALVWGHDLGTQGATLNVRRSPGGTWAGADDVLVATKTPADDKPFLIEFAAPDTQHWGIEVTGATAPSLAIAAIGAALEMPSGLREGFDPVGRVPMGGVNRSVKGNPVGGNVDYEEWSQSLSFEFVAWDWFRSAWVPAWEAHLRGDPFVFAWDPAGHPGELYLVNTVGGFKGPHSAGSVGNLQFDLAGLVS